MQEFDAIRPYSDEETGPAIRRLLNDQEFLDMAGRFRAPRLARWVPALLRPLTRHWLASHFGSIHRVDDLQTQLSRYVGDLVEHTTSAVTHSGLDQLDKQNAYLFISNHRDIVFDPMVVNYLLYHNGFRTTRIAIGDNLLQNRVFAEMMRLNKSFVVRRNLTSPREMRDAYMTLSGFINHSIDTNHSIWIAQREGRAKDGLDCTDPAIIKMFYMSRKKSGLSFPDAMARLHIVPVSIAYEYDPCDLDKARELEIRARTGTYTKAEGEDSEQILKGLRGFKGQVHVHFGTPLQDVPDSPRELAARIDRDMHANYHLYASNLVAYRMRAGNPEFRKGDESADDIAAIETNFSEADLSRARRELEKRLSGCDHALHPYLLDMYANPVSSFLAVSGSGKTPE